MFDDDDLPEPQPPRRRPRILLAALAVTMIAAGGTMWWLYRPRTPTPAPTVERVRDKLDIPREEAEAKKLLEYAELRAMAKKPADAEITRAIELARHANSRIRLDAWTLLSHVRDGPRRADAVNAVAAGLREDSLTMRANAMDLLGTTKARECEGELRAFLTSPVEEDRTCARRALRRMELPTD